MTRRSSRLLLLLAVALGAAPLAAGCTRGAAPASEARFGAGPLIEAPAADAEIVALEQAMFERLNQDRAGQGLDPLQWDAELSEVGRAHSLDMVEGDFFAHDSPRTGSLEQRLTRAGYGFATARENLALGPDVDSAQDSLLDSPGHRANIFSDDVARIGIGIVRGVDPEGQPTLYITQVFARQLEVLDPLEVAARVAERIDHVRTGAGLETVPRLERLDVLATTIARRDGVPRGTELSDAALEIIEASHLRVSMVAAVTGMLYEADDFVSPERLLDPDLVGVGLGLVAAHDEAGRPTVRFVLLLASQ